MAKNTAKKYAEADAPPTKKLSAKERAKAEALARITNRHQANPGDIFAFQLWGRNHWTTTQRH